MTSQNSGRDPFLISPARLEDAEVIADYNIRLAQESEQKSLDPETVLRGVRALFEQSHRGRYLVARSQEMIIGQLMVTLEWSDWRNGEIWWIQSVYVHPDYRGRGVFKSLYQSLLQEAEAHPDVVGIRLYVEHNNHTAQDVYRKLGMKSGNYEVMEFMKESNP